MGKKWIENPTCSWSYCLQVLSDQMGSFPNAKVEEQTKHHIFIKVQDSGLFRAQFNGHGDLWKVLQRSGGSGGTPESIGLFWNRNTVSVCFYEGRNATSTLNGWLGGVLENSRLLTALLTASGLYWPRSRNFLRIKKSLCLPKFFLLTSEKLDMEKESKLYILYTQILA